ncbi:vitamin K epoxide reductase family protein [Chlorogloeopsis sp. ULAP02]|uniref:vitamin K epoxide reductase family protein n=1 Tax=Chlorogloeopsis sp. ULAP02 TaxID=3107926 RepID=UPI003136BDD7
MSRRRSIPWIHRRSRLLIAAIAVCGALTTAYLTVVKFTQNSAACPTQSCDLVLQSEYATVFGLPLALFGFLAYTSMVIFALAPLAVDPIKQKDTRIKVENLTWLLLLAGAIAMSVFSGYLMYLLFFKIQALCIYCLGSAIFSLSMLVLTIIGRTWEDLGQIFFTAVIVGMVTLIGTLGVYANVGQSSTDVILNERPGQTTEVTFKPTKQAKPGVGWEVTTTSGEAEIALASHLSKIGAKEYIAWWCPHCHEQKLLFGKEAYSKLNSIDCAPADHPNLQKDECKAAGIQSYPTWIINGKTHAGVLSLEELAKISGYTGPSNFRYTLRR